MNKNHIVKILLWLLISFLLVLPSLGIIYSRKNDFLNNTYWQRYQAYKEAYYSSQYVKNEKTMVITDEVFNSFAAGFFLLGNNPVYITHDHPPLGRYFVALSILIFKNEHILIIFFQFLTLLALYLISKVLIQDKLVAFLPLFIFAFEPLYLNQFKYTPLLETIQLPFILLSLFFIYKSASSKKVKYFLLISALIGLVVSIRFFPLGVLLYFVWIITILILEPREIKKIIIVTPVIFVVLLVSYFKLFLDGYTLKKVLGVQRYIYEYHKSQLTMLFSSFDLLLFNRWHTWWGENAIITDPQWKIWWPISFFATITGFVKVIKDNPSANKLKKYFLRRENLLELVLLLWIIIYLIFLATGQATTRYFLPVIPIFYILTINYLNKFLKTTGLVENLYRR